MQRRWWEQNRVLREDSREMVGWWYDRTPSQRVRDAVARQQRNELLDELAERILRSEAERQRKEAERQRKWRKQLVKTRTKLAFHLDDLHLDRNRIDAWNAKEKRIFSGIPWEKKKYMTKKEMKKWYAEHPPGQKYKYDEAFQKITPTEEMPRSKKQKKKLAKSRRKCRRNTAQWNAQWKPGGVACSKCGKQTVFAVPQCVNGTYQCVACTGEKKKSLVKARGFI